MSTYKVIDSSISILYCARCANEFLEVVSPGRLVCTDCGMVASFDPKLVKVGQLKGTKYKMRDKRRYSFREIVDEAREDAFHEVFVPSPEPGRQRVGWRSEETEEKPAAGQIRVAGVDDDPGKGWRSETVMNILTDATHDLEEHDDPGNNGQDGATCAP